VTLYIFHPILSFILNDQVYCCLTLNEFLFISPKFYEVPESPSLDEWMFAPPIAPRKSPLLPDFVSQRKTPIPINQDSPSVRQGELVETHHPPEQPLEYLHTVVPTHRPALSQAPQIPYASNGLAYDVRTPTTTVHHPLQWLSHIRILQDGATISLWFDHALHFLLAVTEAVCPYPSTAT